VALTRIDNAEKCLRSMPMLDEHTPVTLARLEASNRNRADVCMPMPKPSKAPCLGERLDRWRGWLTGKYPCLSPLQNASDQ